MFRVGYGFPTEYHLTLSAAGYHDAEAFTPPVEALKPIGGLKVRMRKKKEGTAPAVARQELAGSATRDGKPVKSGWAVLWRGRRPATLAFDVSLLRGRTVATDASVVYAAVPVREGAWAVEVPTQGDDWFLSIEEPDHAPTRVGPLEVKLDEKRRLDVACVEGGEISGRATGIPHEWEGHVWVVAFTKDAARVDARVGADGRFKLRDLPPGEYGLKLGHDAFHDKEVPASNPLPKEWREKPADPWARARVVKVAPGQQVEGVELELPPE
jgi:hypothetical protein